MEQWRELKIIIIIITNRICVWPKHKTYIALKRWQATAAKREMKIILGSARVQWGGEDRFFAQSSFIMPSSSSSSSFSFRYGFFLHVKFIEMKIIFKKSFHSKFYHHFCLEKFFLEFFFCVLFTPWWHGEEEEAQERIIHTLFMLYLFRSIRL